MTKFDGSFYVAHYNTFMVGAAADLYELTVSGYGGNATDAFSSNSGEQFSTTDQDNDGYASGHCGNLYGAGWWYPHLCGTVFLNGAYAGASHSGGTGIVWVPITGTTSSFETVVMKKSSGFVRRRGEQKQVKAEEMLPQGGQKQVEAEEMLPQ
ncbi:hypothetical protein ScPMuIL_008735 [Solemya velum]